MTSKMADQSRDQSKALFSRSPISRAMESGGGSHCGGGIVVITTEAAAPVAVAVPDAEVIAAVAAVASSLHLLE